MHWRPSSLPKLCRVGLRKTRIEHRNTRAYMYDSNSETTILKKLPNFSPGGGMKSSRGGGGGGLGGATSTWRTWPSPASFIKNREFAYVYVCVLCSKKLTVVASVKVCVIAQMSLCDHQSAQRVAIQVDTSAVSVVVF